jgi:hypothetical protein
MPRMHNILNLDLQAAATQFDLSARLPAIN